MIEYAGATLTGCELITDCGKYRAITWRNAHAEKENVSKPEIGKQHPSAPFIHSAFIIITNASPRHYERAMYRVIESGKKLSTLKLALEIQKVEREETRVTGKSKASSDVDNVYDGRIVSFNDRADEGYVSDIDTRHYNYTQLRGKKGRVDNIIRKPSIPPRRAAALDEDMSKLRISMLNERDWWLSVPSAQVHTCRRYPFSWE